MQAVDPAAYTDNMSVEQRAWFFAEYEHARRDELIGVLLAVFLGCFGIHQFYIGRKGLGILYLCFSWTIVPALAGFVDAFFMPHRVRDYNEGQAALLAGQLRGTSSFWKAHTGATPCLACGGPVDAMETACPHCGHETHNPVHSRKSA
jgi:TM2 domain-containing membrane protein YozV